MAARKKVAKVGRPTKYTKAIAAKICDGLAAGKSMRTVCSDPKLPTTRTVWKWLAEDAEFLHQYEKAKDECADMLVEEMLEIADDGRNDYDFMPILRELDPGMTIGELNDSVVLALLAKNRPEGAQRSRLRVDARKWIASRLKPRKYGDKLELGSDPARPLITKIENELV